MLSFNQRYLYSIMESLEDRVLFDGVPDAAFILPVIETELPSQIDLENTEKADFSGPRELVLIDAGVENSQQLLSSIIEDRPESAIEIRVISAELDGVEQVTNVLAGSTHKYDAIHILSHGSDGQLELGNTQLSNDTLADYADQISGWSNSLADSADLLIYGCNLGASSAGIDFIESISVLSGADVAASDDLTGHNSLGGDWDLEIQTGNIESDVVISATGQAAFLGVLAPTPTATVNAPASVLLGEQFEFSVVFDNVGGVGETGYQPFLDVVLPAMGAEDIDEGIDLFYDAGMNPDIKFLGSTSALDYHILEFDAVGNAVHPLTGETITGTPGDTLLVVQPFVGSFSPGQPELTIDVAAMFSDLANLDTPLDIVARAGFDFGDSPTDSGDILSEGTDSSTWAAAATVAPTLLDVEKTYLGPEDETAIGPNFPKQYQIDINVADGQTITDLDIVDYLPNNARFLSVISATSLDGATVFTTTPPTYTLDPVTNQLTYSDPHELLINASTVTGIAGDTPEISIVFEFYIAEFDSQGDRVIPDDNAGIASSGDGEDDIAPGAYPDHAGGSPLLDLDSTSPNDIDVLGDWTPIDPDDAGATDNVYAEPIDASPDHILDNKSIAIQKSVALVTDNNASGYSPGDIVEYTLTFQVSDYFTFSDLAIYDILGDGLLFDQSFDPTFDISDRSGSFAGNFSWTVSADSLDQQTPGAADGLSLPTGNLLVDESRVDRTDDASENAASDGTSHLVFNVHQALLDAGRGNGVLQGGVVLTDAELRPGDSVPDEHDDNPNTAAVGTITFRAVIQQEFADEFPSGDRSVDHGDVLPNNVDIYGTVRDNIDNSMVSHYEDDDSSAVIETPYGVISKTIYAINGDTTLGSTSGTNPYGLIIGDTITYSIEYTLPTSNFENLQIHDFLPLPILEVDDPDGDDNSDESTPDDGPGWYFDSSAPDSTPPAVGTISIGANDTFYNVASSTDPTAGQSHYETQITPSIDFQENRLTFDFGNFDTDLDAGSTINILFTVKVNDAEFDPGLYLTNTIRVTEASTGPQTNVIDDLVLIQMEAPDVSITKGVVASNNPNVTYTSATGPAGVTFAPAGTLGAPFTGVIDDGTAVNANVNDVRPGDTVRFAVALDNSANRASMFDTQLRDMMPPGLTYVTNSLFVVDGTGAAVEFTDLAGASDGSGFFGAGIELLDPGPTDAGVDDPNGKRGAVDGASSGPGRNVIVVFYDAVVTEAAGNTLNFDNTAVLFAGTNTEGGTDLIDTDVTDGATVQRDRVDLELTKSVSNPSPNLGDLVTWTINVTNNSANATTAATGVIVGDTIPSGQQVVVGSATDTSSGTFDYFTGQWTLGAAIAPGATQTLTFESVVGVGSEFSGSFVDLELNAEFDNITPAETDTVNVTVTLTNDGEAATTDATGVTVSDLLPAGMTFVAASDTASLGTFNSGTGVWDLSGDSIAVGQSVTLTFQVTIDGGTAGTAINYSPEVQTLNETDVDSVAGNAMVSEDDHVLTAVNVDDGIVPPPVDLSSRLWVDSNRDGVQDAGEATLAGVTLELWDLSSGTPVMVTTTMTDGSGVYSFAGLAASNDYEIRIAEAEFDSGGLLENFRISKRDQNTIAVAETNVPIGGPAVLDRTNDGTPETADDWSSDVLASHGLTSDGYQVIITDMTGGVARLNDDQVVEFVYDDHRTAGSFSYIIIDHRYDSDAYGYDDDADGMTDRAVVEFKTGTAGGVSDTALDFGLIEEFIDLELDKTVDRKIALENEEVVFTLTLTNEGDWQNATGVTVTDNLPAGLTFIAGSAVASQGTFDGTTWDITGSIGAGQTVTLTYRALVDGVAGAVLLNGAEVATADQVDIDSQFANDDGDRSQDDEDDAAVLIGTRTSHTITNTAQVIAQDQEDWDSTPGNDDHDQSEDDEGSATLMLSIPGAIGNTVWFDEDSNGVLDAGESGVANVLVELKDNLGTVIATTRTDANGNYVFSGLDAGDYFVDIDESTLPPGMSQTTTMPIPAPTKQTRITPATATPSQSAPAKKT